MRPVNDNLLMQAAPFEGPTFARLFAALESDDPVAIEAWLADYRSAEAGTREFDAGDSKILRGRRRHA